MFDWVVGLKYVLLAIFLPFLLDLLYVRYFFRALTWYHNGNKLTPGGRITLSSDNSTVADSGVYEARFDGLLIHPYSRCCEEAGVDLLRHYPVLKPAVFHVGSTSTYTSEYNTRWISIYGSF